MPKQYTNEELIEKVLERIEFPDLGKRATAKKNLMYVRTALGGTFIEVEEEDNVKDKCVTCGEDKDSFSKEFDYEQCENCANEDYFKKETV